MSDLPAWKTTVWQAWLGPRLLPGYLAAAHETVFKHSPTMRVRLVRNDDVPRLLPQVANHPVFPHLSPLHQSEFVRAGLLHTYGGVWLDTDAFVISGDLGAAVSGCEDDGRTLPHQAVIGPLRPNSEFTRAWYAGVLEALEAFADRIVPPNRTAARQLSAAGLQGDCGASVGDCIAWGHKRIPWEFILGDVWDRLAVKFNYSDFNSMACFDEHSSSRCLTCCTSLWSDAFQCASRADVNSSRPRPICGAATHTLRTLAGISTRVAVPAAHVMLGLSSQVPRPVKELSRDEFLSGSSQLAMYARTMLGIPASRETVEAVWRGEGCVATGGANATYSRGARDEVLQRWRTISTASESGAPAGARHGVSEGRGRGAEEEAYSGGGESI